MFSIPYVACQAIAERLERLLNLRIVTTGTEVHEIMEDCLRIARSVTAEGNIYAGHDEGGIRISHRRHPFYILIFRLCL